MLSLDPLVTAEEVWLNYTVGFKRSMKLRYLQPSEDKDLEMRSRYLPGAFTDICISKLWTA